MSYFLKAAQLIILLICLSYFSGMLWIVACDLRYY